MSVDMIGKSVIVSWLAALATAPVCAEPLARCDSPSVDFGEQPGDATLRHVFSVSNAGNTPLTLKVASACCGAMAVISRPTIPPAEATEVTVEFSLMGRTSAFRKVIHLSTDDPSRPFVSLTLSGQVVGTVSASCLDLTFAASETNGGPSQAVVFTGAANRPFAITNIVCDAPWVEAVGQPCSGGVVRLDVRLNPPIPLGRNRAVVQACLDAPPGLFSIPVRLDNPDPPSPGHPQPGELR
jgi:hypothetical protein